MVCAMLIMGADMAPAATAAPLSRLRRRFGLVSVIACDSVGGLEKPQTSIFGHVNKRDKEGFHELVKNHGSGRAHPYALTLKP